MKNRFLLLGLISLSTTAASAQVIAPCSYETASISADGDQLAQERQRPGRDDRRPLPEIDPSAVPPPVQSLPRETLPIPDRWRLVEAIGVNERWWDPYNQNTLKADRPLFDDWFVSLNVISDTVFEPRGVPTPVGPQGGARPGSIDLFGQVDQRIFNQNLITSVSFIKGDTAFKPPDW